MAGNKTNDTKKVNQTPNSCNQICNKRKTDDHIIALDKDGKQLGIYSPLFLLIGYFKFLNWVSI